MGFVRKGKELLCVSCSGLGDFYIIMGIYD